MSDRLTTALFARESGNAYSVDAKGANKRATSAYGEGATSAPSR